MWTEFGTSTPLRVNMGNRDLRKCQSLPWNQWLPTVTHFYTSVCTMLAQMTADQGPVSDVTNICHIFSFQCYKCADWHECPVTGNLECVRKPKQPVCMSVDICSAVEETASDRCPSKFCFGCNWSRAKSLSSLAWHCILSTGQLLKLQFSCLWPKYIEWPSSRSLNFLSTEWNFRTFMHKPCPSANFITFQAHNQSFEDQPKSDVSTDSRRVFFSPIHHFSCLAVPCLTGWPLQAIFQSLNIRHGACKIPFTTSPSHMRHTDTFLALILHPSHVQLPSLTFPALLDILLKMSL